MSEIDNGQQPAGVEFEVNQSDVESLLRRIHRFESRVEDALRRRGYGGDYDSPIYRSGSTDEDDQKHLSPLSRSISYRFVDASGSVADLPRLPQAVRDLGRALHFFSVLRAMVSAGQFFLAIELMHRATVFALRGDADLFKRDEASAKGRKMGKRSGEQRRSKARRGWPVYDHYLLKTRRSAEDNKTASAQRAHRALLKDCERFHDAKRGDEEAARRFDERAPQGLKELLEGGWEPPTAWRTLYKRQRSSKKQ